MLQLGEFDRAVWNSPNETILLMLEKSEPRCDLPSLKNYGWNLKMLLSKRNLLFQVSIFRFYVSFQV